jgi:hypothetical protein
MFMRRGYPGMMAPQQKGPASKFVLSLSEGRDNPNEPKPEAAAATSAGSVGKDALDTKDVAPDSGLEVKDAPAVSAVTPEAAPAAGSSPAPAKRENNVKNQSTRAEPIAVRLNVGCLFFPVSGAGKGCCGRERYYCDHEATAGHQSGAHR